jgi:MFS transporter, DHA1 family, inner membrane transport protein
MSKKERIIVILLAALNFTHILDFIVMVPLSIYLIPNFQLSGFQFSVLVASYSVSAFFSGIFVAAVIDRFDRKRFLILAYIGFLLSTLACGLSVNFEMLLASRILAGIFGGVLGAQVLAIVSDLFTYERRGAAMGAVMSAFAVATVVGIPLSFWVADIFNSNWHIPFLGIAGIGVVLLPLMIKHLPVMHNHLERLENRSIKTMFAKTLNLAIKSPALIFSVLFMMGHFLIIPFIPTYLKFNKYFTDKQIMFVLLCGGIASFISAIFLGKFSDKKGKLPVFVWSVICSLFLIVILTNMPDMYFPVALGFFALLFMVVTCRIVMAQAMISEMVDQDKRGSFMCINGSAQQLGQGLAALFAGMIIRADKVTHKLYNYEWVGYLSIGVLIGSLLMGRVIFRYVDRTVEEISMENELFKETA